jgi:hypothetical protein
MPRSEDAPVARDEGGIGPFTIPKLSSQLKEKNVLQGPIKLN